MSSRFHIGKQWAKLFGYDFIKIYNDYCSCVVLASFIFNVLYCIVSAEIVSLTTHYCPAIEPPQGGYLHCSSRPNEDGYKPGTSCRLRCRKGYVFQRQKPQIGWQNQVLDTSDDNNLGLAILQGWKATQIWKGDWQPKNISHDAAKVPKKRLKGDFFFCFTPVVGDSCPVELPVVSNFNYRYLIY